MKKFNKVTIVGVGLLGGSIGQAIKQKNLAEKVVGFFRNTAKITNALKIGAIDEGTDNFENSIEGSDFIILCSPINDIIKKLQTLKNLNKKDILITDVGSTKSEIMKAAQGLNFIGSHPLAGSEQSGAEHAKVNLFDNSTCIICPGKNNSVESLKRISEFWKQLGTKTILMSPSEHDKILASTSHLPHITAFSLIDVVPQKDLKFAAGGLKDTTRVALSNPDIWTDIFLSNKNEILKTINSFEKSLKKLKEALRKNNAKTLFSLLKNSQNKRKDIQ